MEEILIRPATPGDMDTLLRFEQGVIRAERPFDPTLDDGPIHYYDLHELMASADSELLVAELAGRIIASGYVRIEQSKHYLRHAVHGYLGFMYVEPEHRGKGVNRLIISGLTDWCHERGVTELRLEVYIENMGAIRAYEKEGFVKHMVEMRKGLAD
jgi:GNAT superfamily N-acetyltransferase